MRTLLGVLLASAVFAACAASPAPAWAAEPTKIVMIAGRPSHGPGDHEFNAGILLLAKCLRESGLGIDPVVVKGGWPENEAVFDGASSVVFFMDGGGGHPMIQKDRLERVMKPLLDKGVGLLCMHYAVEVPKGKPGDFFLDWLGGYYETGFSTNPHWIADVKSLPDHPITRGVKPFSIRDEWYFNIRFRPDMKDVTPIIVAKPDDQTRKGVSSSPRGPYKHIVEATGRDEVLAWAVERPVGGRAFGFTGGHSHKNWGNDDFRTLVLNAILWSAKLDVPSTGVKCSVSEDELNQNLDPKGRR
jgi:hypothetical protein